MVDALGQSNAPTIQNVVLITDKQQLPELWESLLASAKTKEFDALLKKAPELTFEVEGEVGFLFDHQALGFEVNARFSRIVQELVTALASGQQLQDVKLSQLPEDVQESLRQRFVYHKAIELKGLERLDPNVSLTIGMKLTFERDGKKVRVPHLFPYQKPRTAAVAQMRTVPDTLTKRTPGALTRSVLPPRLVAHFSDSLLMSDVLMVHSSMAFAAAARHMRAISDSNRAAIDDLWRQAMKCQKGVDAEVIEARSLQDLPEGIRDVLLRNFAQSYAHYGFNSAEEAAEFLRFARVSHADRELGFSIVYSVDGRPGSFELVLTTVLDHR
jgi:hypothetical protein